MSSLRIYQYISLVITADRIFAKAKTIIRLNKTLKMKTKVKKEIHIQVDLVKNKSCMAFLFTWSWATVRRCYFLDITVKMLFMYNETFHSDF